MSTTAVVYDPVTGEIKKTVRKPLSGGGLVTDLARLASRMPGWEAWKVLVTPQPLSPRSVIEEGWYVDPVTEQLAQRAVPPKPVPPIEVERMELVTDSRVQAILTKSPAELEAWIDANVATLAQARTVLKLLLRYMIWDLKH